MKKFVPKIACFFVLTLFSMLLLDMAYTKVYKTSNPRTKIQYLRTLKDKKVDYIFIGSSRLQSGIVPSVIEKKLNKKVLNFGFQAARLNDIYAVLQLISYYDIRYEKIFIQVDYIYNFNANSPIFQFETMPFIHENSIYSNHIKFNPSNDFKYDCIPFYRYSRNDLKLGIREICLNLSNKKTNAMSNEGYSPLEGTSVNHNFPLPEKINEYNNSLDNIQKFCRKNKINVIFYCAPFCKHTSNLDFIAKLKNKIPGLLDFSTVVTDESMFQNANHLNDKGARYFTEFFVEEVLTNK